jgi:hypothetical protein
VTFARDLKSGLLTAFVAINIRISQSDLFSPAVEDYLELQEHLRRDIGDVEPQPLLFRIVYSSWFYLSVASGLGALAGWIVLIVLGIANIVGSYTDSFTRSVHAISSRWSSPRWKSCFQCPASRMRLPPDNTYRAPALR